MADCDYQLHAQHAMSHLECMYNFYKQEMYCDIEIIHGDKRYAVHKSILLTASQFFRDTLSTNASEIVMSKSEGIRGETVDIIIQYLYEGTLKPMIHQVANILKLANIWQLYDLKKVCYLYLENALQDYDHVSPVLKQIDEHYLNNFSEMIMHEEFLNMPVAKLKALLQSDDLQISSEEDALKGLSLWVKNDWNNRKQHLYTLLKCIRLDLCSVSFLLDEVCTLYCEWFDEFQLLYDALQRYQNPEKKSNRSLTKPRNKIDRTVLIVGGDNNSYAHVIEAYNPTLNTWSIFHYIDEGITSFSSAIFDDKMLMFGGLVEDKITNKVWCLDLLTKAFTKLPRMKQKRIHSTAAVVDGRVFVIGGKDSKENALNTVEEWNPVTKTWRFVSSMHFERYKHVTVVYKDEIYVIGGVKTLKYLDDVEIYCSKTDTWRNVSYFQKINSRGILAVDYVDKFDPNDNTWSSGNNLIQIVHGHGVIKFNNKIICFGDMWSSVVVEYNPDTDKWKEIGKLTYGRRYYNVLTTKLKL